jgi:tRNA threonylcarbamoyladenosine biosynthesis protein TsaE
MASNAVQIELSDPSATAELGRRLGSLLFPGAIVALVGPLGAGKTHLVRAIAEGLGLRNPREVSSPTFGLIHEYRGRLPISHFDVYRLQNVSEFLDLGVNEYFDSSGVCLIEWADKVASSLPAERLDIEIEITGDSTRRLILNAKGERYQKLVAAMSTA